MMKRVLIMEDSVELAMDWRDALERNGYTVQLTYSGEEAIRALEKAAFDVVITDLFTNTKQGGLALIARLKTMGAKAPPVIAVTGAPNLVIQNADKSLFLGQAEKLGASYTFTKPVPAAELVVAADELISRV